MNREREYMKQSLSFHCKFCIPNSLLAIERFVKKKIHFKTVRIGEPDEVKSFY